MPRSHPQHLGFLQDENGIDGNLLDRTVRSEQPPNSSNFSRFVTTAPALPLLSPLRTKRLAPKGRGDEEL